jgi:enoyl-CoA hydratase/carnithine racemase
MSVADRIAALTPADGDLFAHREGGVQWLVFNRPAVRNAISKEMTDRLIAVRDEINAGNTDVRVVVLTGAGGSFTAGGDIGNFKAMLDRGEVPGLERTGNAIYEVVDDIKVPTIAAISGPCTGGGALIAAHCDLRIASPSARYGYPIARTLGNTLGVREYARMTALLGLALTTEMFMTARLLDAQEMRKVGLIMQLTDSEESLYVEAERIANIVASNAPITLQTAKEALHLIREDFIPDGDDLELRRRAYGSEDFKEGVNAFLEKRKPVWRGR